MRRWRTARRIGAIRHLERLRIHTRMPIVVPSRIQSSLTDRLAQSRFSIWIVLHSNHSREFDAEVGEAIQRLRASGANLLNQASTFARNQRYARRPGRTMPAAPETFGHSTIFSPAGSCPRSRAISIPIQPSDRRIIEQLIRRLPGYAVPR